MDVASSFGTLSILEVAEQDTAWDHEHAELLLATDPRTAATAEELQAYREAYQGVSSRFAARDDGGALIGCAFAGFAKGVSELAHAWIGVCIREPHSNSEALGVLADLAVSWSQAQGACSAESIVYEDRPEELACLFELGFVECARNEELELTLTEAVIPPAHAVVGLRIASLEQQPQHVEQVYDVWRAGLLDIPGETGEHIPARDAWIEAYRLAPGQRDSARWVVLDASDEVVGYTSLMFHAARPETAGHGMLTVRRDRRGEGIGRLLKHHAIRHAWDIGITRLETANERRNAAILHLNQSLGYVAATPMIRIRREF